MEQREKVWCENRQALRSYIQQNIPDSAEARNIQQDVFITMYSKINTINDPSKIKGWLFQVARAAIINHYRESGLAGKMPGPIGLSTLDKKAAFQQNLAHGLTGSKGKTLKKFQ